MLRAWLYRFARDRKANVAVIFALVMVPTIFLLGMALDYTHAQHMKVDLDAATDAFTWATAAVDDAIAAGLLVTDDPLLLSLTLWAGAHGVATVLQLGFGLPTDLEDRMVDDITDRILAGYAA